MVREVVLNPISSCRPRRDSVSKKGERTVATTCDTVSRERLQELMTVSKCLSDGMSQKDVADQLGKGEPAISLLKREALAYGILRVTYHPPRLSDLESRLKDKLTPYRIRDVVVCARDVGVAAARYYETIVDIGHTLVLDGGITVSDFVAALASVSLPPSLTVIPLCADPPSYDVSAYECMTRLATLFPGVVHCEKLPHLTSPQLDKDHRRIRRLAASADTVVLGCGPWKAGFTASEFLRNLGLRPQRFRAKYRNVTCVCGYCALDYMGRLVRLRHVERLMPRALDFDGIRKLSASSDSRVILLAQTANKAASVLNSLAAGMASVVIVDEDLARSLLRICEEGSGAV